MKSSTIVATIILFTLLGSSALYADEGDTKRDPDEPVHMFADSSLRNDRLYGRLGFDVESWSGEDHERLNLGTDITFRPFRGKAQGMLYQFGAFGRFNNRFFDLDENKPNDQGDVDTYDPMVFVGFDFLIADQQDKDYIPLWSVNIRSFFGGDHTFGKENGKSIDGDISLRVGGEVIVDTSYLSVLEIDKKLKVSVYGDEVDLVKGWLYNTRLRLKGNFGAPAIVRIELIQGIYKWNTGWGDGFQEWNVDFGAHSIFDEEKDYAFSLGGGCFMNRYQRVSLRLGFVHSGGVYLSAGYTIQFC